MWTGESKTSKQSQGWGMCRARHVPPLPTWRHDARCNGIVSMPAEKHRDICTSMRLSGCDCHCNRACLLDRASTS